MSDVYYFSFYHFLNFAPFRFLTGFSRTDRYIRVDLAFLDEMTTVIDIPVDTYDSPQEFVVVMPLGGVDKASVRLSVKGQELIIQGSRKAPSLKSSLVPQQTGCFRGSFERRVKLTTGVAFDRIHSTLSPENILIVIVPKIIIPENIAVQVQ